MFSLIANISYNLNNISFSFVFFSLTLGGPHGQHSYPNLNHRRGGGRRLPPTPSKPSTLQLKPTNINFPKLNASPTHVSIFSKLTTEHFYIHIVE